MSDVVLSLTCSNLLKLCISSSVRKILAPGEEENLELEEEDAAAGAGSTEAFPPRAPGTVASANQQLTETHPLFGMFAWLCHFVLVFLFFF